MAKSKKKKLTIESEKHWDETFRLMSWWDPETVKGAVVLVVGAGALGNEVLKNLALMNVGQIFVMDFDTVEYSNLARSILFREEDIELKKTKAEVAAIKLNQINPNIRVQAINGDLTYQLGLGLIRRCDVVIGCLDNRIARLYINRFCSRFEIPWIDGAIENLAGTMTVFKRDFNCYECNLSETEWKHIRFRLGCPDVAQRNIKLGKIPTTPVSSSIIGAMQVQEALKIIHKNYDKIEFKQKFYYEGMNNVAMWIDSYHRTEECESHVDFNDVIEGPTLSADMTLKAFRKALKPIISEKFNILLDNELVLELTSNQTEESYKVTIPKPAINDNFLAKFITGINEDFIITDSINVIQPDSGLEDVTLKDIGIPYLGILALETKDNIIHVELTHDLNKYPLIK